MLRTTLFYFTISALYSVLGTPPRERPTNGVKLCEYDGKFYVSGKIFNKKSDGKGGCSGLRCDDGVVKDWEAICSTVAPTTQRTIRRKTTKSPRTTIPPTTIPFVTTLPMPTTPLGCEFDGKFYRPGEEIESGEDRDSGWCYGSYCDEEGNVVAWDNFNCFPTTTPRTPTSYFPDVTTTPLPTTFPSHLGCEHEGKFYDWGEEISRESDDHGTCFILYCDYEGNIISREDFSCGITSPLPTTKRFTALPPLPGCHYGGKFYPPGEEISRESDGEGWCYGLICDEDGNLRTWENWNCVSTTPTTATTPPTKAPTTATTPPTKIPTIATTQPTKAPTTSATNPPTILRFTTPPPRPGCNYEGKFYLPGEEISRGSDGEGWCYGMICDTSGQILNWDDWNCGSTTPITDITPPTKAPTTPTTPPTKAPTTATTPPTKASTTSATNPPAQTSKSPSTKRHTPFTASSTVNTLSTDSPDEPTSRSTTPIRTTPKSIGWCYFNGQYFVRGEVISRVYHAKNWCSGWYCNDGKIDPWNDFNCPNPNAFHQSTPPVPRCYFNGMYYNEGEVVTGGEGSGDCEGFYCNGGQLIPFRGSDCGSSAETNDSNVSPTNTDSLKNQTTQPTTTTATTTEAPALTFTKTKPESLMTTPTSQAEGTVTTAEPKLCFHEGKYYEEGDIISRDFDADDWCSGWYCKGGRLIPLDCGVTSSVVNKDTHKPIPTERPSPEPARCFHEGRYYEEGDLATIGNDLCSGLLCKDGKMIQWDDCLIKKFTPSKEVSLTTSRSSVSVTITDQMEKQTKPSAAETTKASVSNLTPAPTARSTILSTTETTNRGDITPPVDAVNLTTAQSEAITTSPEIPRTQPSTASSITSPTARTETTLMPEPKLCFHEGNYYEEGDIISRDFDGDDWCSGWHCKGGRLILLDCGGTIGAKAEGASSWELIPPKTLGPEPSRCFHEGRYYDEGDLATIGNDWCSGLLCKNGEMISWNDCVIKKFTPSKEVTQITATITDSVQKQTKFSTTEITKVSTVFSLKETQNVTTPTTQGKDSTTTPEPKRCFLEGKYYEEGDIISTDPDGGNWCSDRFCKGGQIVTLDCGDTTKPVTGEDIDSPEPVPTSTISPEPSRCLHEGKYYDEGDLETTGRNWCSWLLCKNGEMVLWGNCVSTPRSTTLPTTETTKTSETTLSPTEILTTAQSEATAKSPAISRISTASPVTSPSPQTEATTSSPMPARCFHDGKYYEDGDIISRDFDGEDWCSGLHCKDGRLISLDCGATTSSLPKVDISTTRRLPEPSRCFHDGRYYEDGDLATVGNDWCSGWLCKDGEMISWNNCQIKLSTAPSTKIPEALTTKTTKPIKKSSTTTLPDPTSTPEIPTKPQKTTARQPLQTAKPEKQSCYYKGKFYPPGEVTRGVLRDGRCYGVICDISGIIVQWVTPTCAPTQAPTAEIKATLPGCVYRDKYYPPGRISRISDGGKWCLDVICTKEGEIVSRNILNCDQSTTRAPLTTTTSTPNTKEVKCLYNGVLYSPGVISEGIDKNKWCYKVVCRDNGQLYLWGDWNCKFTLRTTTPSPPETTIPQPKICTYNGKKYPVGEITRGEDISGWCFGVTCRHDGQVVLWGSFKCGKI